MSVIVFAEQSEGSFKKKALEAVQYAANIAERLGSSATAVVLGSIAGAAMQELGKYGASKVLHVADGRLDNFSSRAAAKALIAAANKESAKVIVLSHDVVGRAVAPRVSAALSAGLVAGAVALPEVGNGFVVRKNVFAGKAFADVSVNSEVKVITLMPNTFAVVAKDGTATVEALEVVFTDEDFSITVTATNKVSGTVPLSEAELVVSGGRGLKGPENWGILEDLAGALGASLACSRPVADSHWRPHHEHVGQTGGTIRPNLYIAVGISGAIQHLAGVNGSKTIVVINKDPEAPFFKAADYGIVGDALTIIPKLTAAVKAFKAS
ncbi:MAG: electron transfer flavoprotein subunit alpha/FixB family protein [Bacteroidetes bacterium]|nr:electron transfer flavoprotein subunit alpha/FixB family protein [Bacteroidota bacterium]